MEADNTVICTDCTGDISWGCGECAGYRWTTAGWQPPLKVQR